MSDSNGMPQEQQNQDFGDYEKDYPGVSGAAVGDDQDDPTVYDTQTFRIPEGIYDYGTLHMVQILTPNCRAQVRVLVNGW
jgi:hypothetical protein